MNGQETADIPTGHDLPDGVILPQHRSWFRRFTRETRELSIEELFQKNNASYELYRNTARPESDPLDIFRQEVQKPLDFSQREQIRQAQDRLTQQLEKDIQAVLEEHQKLQYQSRIWPLNSPHTENNWPGLERHSETKALSFLHAAQNYAEWKVCFIRYLRYRWENQQADKLQAFIAHFHKKESLTESLSAENLLKGHTVGILDTLHIPFIAADKNAVINPGKLQELNITGDERVLLSPKFYLAMPDNPFVHAGNRSYVNLYQVVAIQRQGQTGLEYFLLADFYYAPLSLQELKEISEHFLPNQRLPESPSEQLILETTGILPDEFTNAPPFELFLEVANSLQRNVAIPFVQTQARNQAFIAQQKSNVRRGAALFSQILLTEYALTQYLPQRKNYVSEVLSRTFEVILIAVFTGQELTAERSTQILHHYRKTLVLDLEQLREDEVSWETFSVQRQKQSTTKEVQEFFSTPDLHARQKDSVWKNRELLENANVFALALEPFITGAATGIPSCASCLLGAASKLGGVKPIPGGTAATVATAGGTAQPGWSGGSSGLPFSLGGYSGGSSRPWGSKGPFDTFLPDFLQKSFSSAGDAWNEFHSYIRPNDLLTYFLSEQAVLPTR